MSKETKDYLCGVLSVIYIKETYLLGLYIHHKTKHNNRSAKQKKKLIKDKEDNGYLIENFPLEVSEHHYHKVR